jgi:hypothetical protein
MLRLGQLCPMAHASHPPAGCIPCPCRPAECAICFDSTCDVAVAGCGHGICFVCACKMVARSADPSCPFCRGPIKEFKQLTGARRAAAPT